ncbi:HAD-IIIA family hydrolase [Amphritea sp. 2_MG-2023]|nr:HAD-IIIA family hydrolase [Amphritea sp. 2_MG-2023]MDO6418781.1 HAD-IIIA family hydrolase [Amphritea sp. 2_MG-2023]
MRAIFHGVAHTAKPENPLKNIRLVITDVDGVLTDGSIFYDVSGECIKRFHVRDGLGIRMLEESGIRVAVLSGRDSETLRKRIQDLGISMSLLGVKDKLAACDELMLQAEVIRSETVFIGDDTIDLPAFLACGYSFAVADAPDYVKNKASMVLSKAGGDGAFREVSDLILDAQNKSDVYSTAEGFATVMSGAAQ